jgi:hypothetical protein
VRLDGERLINVNLAGLHALIDKHIAGVRVVPNGTGWQREYFSYAFAPLPKGPPRWEDRGKEAELCTEPDDRVLKQIYMDELLLRIPRVE